MKRKPLTKLQRIKLFDDHHGTCCICKFKIHEDKGFIVEHIKPLWLGGADDERNMGPAHKHCARDKTSAEAPVKAKGDRVRARHLGIRKPSTFRGWRKFDGTPVQNLRRART